MDKVAELLKAKLLAEDRYYDGKYTHLVDTATLAERKLAMMNAQDAYARVLPLKREVYVYENPLKRLARAIVKGLISLLVGSEDN